MSNQYVAHRVGPGWIVADSSGIIAVGTDEPEILDELEAAYGPMARLEESDSQTFLTTLQVGQANQLREFADAIDKIHGDFEASKERLLEAGARLAEVENEAGRQREQYQRDRVLAGKDKRRSELHAAFLAAGFKPYEVAALIESQLREEYHYE